MDDEEMRIVITIKKTDSGYTSAHRITGIGELAAGIVLIDIGRDILLNLASHHHHAPDAGQKELESNGH